MKRAAYTLLIVIAAGGTWRAVDGYRTRHPVTGSEITVPGKNGVNTLLVSGWKTTPAGRQLASGDMILSGQISPDGKLFAFTNTGYTRHNLHIVDLATEKEIATFPMEQAWSGLAFAPDGTRIFVSGGAGYPSTTSRTSIAGTTAAGRRRGRRLHAAGRRQEEDGGVVDQRFVRRQTALRTQQLG